MERAELILAEILLEQKQRKNYSFQDIADKMNMSRFTIRDYLVGRTRLYWSTAIDLCDALGLSYEDTMNEVMRRLRK